MDYQSRRFHNYVEKFRNSLTRLCLSTLLIHILYLILYGVETKCDKFLPGKIHTLRHSIIKDRYCKIKKFNTW